MNTNSHAPDQGKPGPSPVEVAIACARLAHELDPKTGSVNAAKVAMPLVKEIESLRERLAIMRTELDEADANEDRRLRAALRRQRENLPEQLAWHSFTTGTPREQLRPEYRAAAEAAVAAGTARWAIVAGETRLRWNYPQPASRYGTSAPEPVDGPKYPEIEVELVGEDGNAANIIGKVRLALRQAQVPAAEVDQFCREAMSGDYDNVIATAMRWVDVS